MSSDKFDLARFPVHLGLGAVVSTLPEFTGSPQWYEEYGASTAADGDEGRLVSLHSFADPWSTWEMHPRGEELVVCVSGSITLFQEVGDEVRSVALEPGEAVVNPAGIWHTADVDREATALFVTAGAGTEVRPR
jgi:mannose-6-phosphate isomerase-like protein (cupin superfamily)